MRINAGSCKGMRLQSPRGTDTRPTSAKVREALMSMLATRIEGATIIDLFAGSGAIGIEAISRGAAAAFFVESGRDALKCLIENVNGCRRRCEKDQRPPVCLKVLAGSVGSQLGSLVKRGFVDVVWADPPYDKAIPWLSSRDLCAVAQLVSPGGLLIVECRLSDYIQAPESPGRVGAWQKIKEKRYGKTGVIVWERLVSGDRV